MNLQNKSNQPIFFIVAGEASGDLHGAKLIRAIKKKSPKSRFIGHGGDKMTEAGLERMIHTDQLAFMGFSEVIKHLPFMIKAMDESLTKLQELKPNRIILIDYPGFNLRLAKNCQELKIPITYFILPQLWAWKENRIKSFRNHIDQSLSIFPFEQDWFESRGISAKFVGHPFSEIEIPKTTKVQFFSKHKIDESDTILVLLPGSRQQEIDRHWPICRKTVAALRQEKPDLKVIVGKAGGVEIPKNIKGLIVEDEDIRAAMAFGTVALTASGTATLECAVLDIPEVVFYKLSTISGIIANKLNKSPFAAMVNLIAGREVVREFLQKDATEKNLANALNILLEPSKERRGVLSGYDEVRRSLGIPGVYDRAAEMILKRTCHG
ncbi:MAG: lipid-A-disaccharide synthase [Candidatus Marinimicrobia bacterium]|nr:lipid-A-disaccharide synthase [Candidatus Neomarinimicrobiota bacterium]